jgi:hypothetical protein
MTLVGMFKLSHCCFVNNLRKVFMDTFNDFLADLNALMRQLPMTDIESVLWLNSLQYNCVMAAERIQREDLSKESFGGTD